MNWSKFLTVMILVFLSLNILLFGYQRLYEKKRYELSAERQEQVRNYVNSKGVLLYYIIPSYYPKNQIELSAPKVEKEIVAKNILGDIQESRLGDTALAERRFNSKESLTFYGGDQEGLVFYKSDTSSYIPKDMTVNSINDIALNFAKDLFGSEVNMFVTYRRENDDAGEKGYFVELNEIYKDTIIFQNYIRLKITKNGIQEAIGIRYKPIDLIGAKKNIYPFDEVIYSLMYYMEDEFVKSTSNDTLPEKTITDIDIGYYLIDVDQRKIVYQVDPYYRIIFADGETYFINAYTNDITKQ